MQSIVQEAWQYLNTINPFEFAGLIFGLLAVYYLIKDNILTWPMGIIYCFLSFTIYWQAKLYQDFVLTGFFLVMNIYGWYYWTNGKKDKNEVPITTSSITSMLVLGFIALFYIITTGFALSKYTDAALPYWDATTTGLSFIAMWLTARKKIENWVLWLVVDILSTGVYYVKGLYFYSLLYCVYIVMAIIGWREWKKLMNKQ